jgi:hypothetical protein
MPPAVGVHLVKGNLIVELNETASWIMRPSSQPL